MQEHNEEENFEALLEQSEATMLTRVSQGQKLNARVVHISGEFVHVDIGMRSEAVLEKTEDERMADLHEGSQLNVYVLKTGAEVRVGLDPVVGLGDVDVILEAHENQQPVEGLVHKANRGGFEVHVAGVRCFCPISQIDERRTDDPSVFVGKKMLFKIVECDEEAKNPIVSHRILLDEERQKLVRETWSLIHPDAVIKGKVREIKSFGAFVDLGGVLGLVHISELAHHRVERVEDMLTEGDEIEVKVLNVEKDARGKDRISLSLKALTPDPWDVSELKENQLLKGRIVRKKGFGLFVALEPGIEGLLPNRYLKRAGRFVDADDLELDSEIEVQIVDFNRERKQVSLAIPGWDTEIDSALKPGDFVKVRVTRIIHAGLLVEGLDDPARGLLPKRFLDKSGHQSLEKHYAPGTELETIVESIDERGRYAFAPRPEKEEVDPKVLQQFMTDDDSMSHNPFSAFFSDKKS